MQLRRDLLTIRWRVCAHRNHFSAELLDLPVIFLQLAELRAAEPSSLCPVKDHENAFLALEGIQINSRALNRKTHDVRGHALNLRCQKQRDNQ